MPVRLLAVTQIVCQPIGWKDGIEQYNVSDPDMLAEMAGRVCYQSWNRPNPLTGTNDLYLEHIIQVGHFSVLEHSSATFELTEVSRSFLAELTRHRHLSFSVQSQRYCDYSGTKPVIPPAIAGNPGLTDIVEESYSNSLLNYDKLVKNLSLAGMPRKKAMEAARSVLPNCAPVTVIVTGNMRAWREMLKKRLSEFADAEMRTVANQILHELHNVAPNTFQDMINLEVT